VVYEKSYDDGVVESSAPAARSARGSVRSGDSTSKKADPGEYSSP